MKNKTWLFISVLMLFIGIEALKAQGRIEAEANVKEMLESGSFTIAVNRALPTGGSAIDLTSSYSLTFKKDSVFSHLPYFGRAYNVPYGGSNGLRFDERILSCNASCTELNEGRLTFLVRTKDDIYTFDIWIYADGSTHIDVQPVNKQSICFHGNLHFSPNAVSE